MPKDCCTFPQVCTVQDVHKIDELIYLLKNKVTKTSNDILGNLYYGYGGEINKLQQYLNKLTTLKEVLEYQKKGLIVSGKHCSTPELFQMVIEKTIKEVGKEPCYIDKRKDVVVDDSGLDKYMLSKPYCISYDKWDEFARKICGDIGFTVTVEKEICDITFEISRQTIPCNLLYHFKVQKEMCDLNMTVNRTVDECKIDYKLLAEKYCNFNLSLKEYIELVKEYNLGFNTIDEVYKNKLELAILNRRAVLKSQLNTYDISKISPSDLTKLIGLGFKVTAKRNTITQEYI